MCPDCSITQQKTRCRNYKNNNKEKVSNYNKQYKSENKDIVKQYNHEYNIANRKIIQTRQTKQHKIRRHTDPNYKMTIVLRNRLAKFVNNTRVGSIKKLIGCEQIDFIKWIESCFIGDMTWENHGPLWHIDHVIPCHSFDLTDLSQQLICFNWKNMRPLYAKINMSHQYNIHDILLQELKTHTFYTQHKNIGSFNNLQFGVLHLPNHVGNHVMALVNR
jgi:hypothetical protein